MTFAGPTGWRLIPPVTRVTLVAASAGYLVRALGLLPLDALVAIPAEIYPGAQIWRLLTYPLVNVGIVTILFDLLLLWSFGWQQETRWGSGSYATFLLLATGTGGALGVGAALLVPGGGFGAGFGLAGPLTALIAAWMLEAPNQPSNLFGILPMTRKTFALLAVVVVAFGEIEQTRSVARLIFVLGGIPAAWYWTRGRGSTFRLPPGPFRRRRFRVIRSDEGGRIN